MPEGVDGLAESLLALSQLMVSEETVDATLSRVASIASRTIGAAEMAGVTVVRDGVPATVAFTDAEAPEIDRAQYDSDAGPCLEAYRTGTPIRVQSMSDDTRWPAFGQAALNHGIQSSLSLPLIVRGETLGALNLYSRHVAGFDDADEELGGLFAAQAAVSVANAQLYWSTYDLTEQLRAALVTRDLIGQAKGILMTRLGVTADEAFDLLRTASQRLNIKLREVADTVALTGELPPES
jgi:GAF domain-containing protein